jgi:hypothetical protein
MGIWKQYADALRPQLPAEAKIAILMSGSHDKHHSRTGGNPDLAGLWDWDAGLTNEPWFDAVAWHPYPETVESMHSIAPHGLMTQTRQKIDDRVLGASSLRSDEDATPAFKVIMERIEEGAHR